MLKYILTDTSGIVTGLSEPVSMNLVSSSDAPADSLRITFALSGDIPVVYSVRVQNGGDTVFFGYADEQTETVCGSGVLLTVKARSLAAVLLDNEACPQVYCLPTMEMLFQRHFRPLGFEGYTGGDRVCRGDLVISKGMSEWQVLSRFCRSCGLEEPWVTHDGIIVTDGRQADTIFLDGASPRLRLSRTVRRNALISDIYIRTSKADGYAYHMENDHARENKGLRIRYLNAADDFRRSPAYAKKMMDAGNSAYITCTVQVGGIISCRTGDRLVIGGQGEGFIIRELRYILGRDGEMTVITAEVENNVDIKKYG